MKTNNFKKELARDFLALGSWVFFILVIARALIQPYRPFVDQMIIAGIILILINLIFKDYDGYIAKGLILFFFVSIFYKNNFFTAFVTLTILGLIISSYLSGNSRFKIIKGIIIGAISTLISYYLATYTINLF